MRSTFVLGVWLMVSGTAIAQVAIPGLYNTGLNASGGPLSEGAQDPNYILNAFPAGNGYGPAHTSP